MDQLSRLSNEPISRLGELPLLSMAVSGTVLDAVKLMRQGSVGCVLVCDGKRAVGIMTERDVLRRMGASKPLDVPVNEAMSRELWALRPNDTVGRAIRIMKKRQCRHLPVLSPADEPIGVLSVKRIVRELVEHFPSAVYNLPPTPNNDSQGRDGA